MLNRISMPKVVVIIVLIIATFKDGWTDTPINDISLFVIGGMLVAIAWQYIFDTNHTRSN